MYDAKDTIVAVATAPGKAGISVVRISGEDSILIADRIFRGKSPIDQPSGTFRHGYIGNDNANLDEVILLLYRAPHSYTRENVVELQCHGGRAVTTKVLRAVISAGARPAEPGEFTLRAFLNGRIDLAQAEAVHDLVEAQTSRAASAALEQLDGSLSREINRIYDIILSVASDLESTLDFEDNILGENILTHVITRIERALHACEDLLNSYGEGRIIREGALVVITGKPNVGKSTLLNRILGYDRAIVTDQPGTTRDTIEESLSIGGYLVRLVDTAGIRESNCEIEKQGVDRAGEYLAKADYVIHMLDASEPLNSTDRKRLSCLNKSRTVIVLNKCDIQPRLCVLESDFDVIVETSLTDGGSAEPVLTALGNLLPDTPATEPGIIINSRHYSIIQNALNILNKTKHLLPDLREDNIIICAQILREALDKIGTILGKTCNDEILDSVFSKFCIGK